MRDAQRIMTVVALAALTAGCAVERNAYVPTPTAPRTTNGIYKVGNPYQIDGTWYYPREQPDYDETGVASWYGPNFYGQATANGETYNAGDLTAAHRTLPMPVNVRVTNLDNGRSLIVRVNDRGPFAKGRIIDVSEQAAKLLGFYGQGTAKVRVTFVSRADLPNGQPQPDTTPPEIASAVQAAPTGKVEVASLEVPQGTAVSPPLNSAPLPQPATQPSEEQIAATQPTGQVTTVSVPAVTHLYVQVGAFSTLENARRIQSRIGNGLTISTIERNGQKLYRVRLGPFDQVADADQALAHLSSQGSNDARIVVDQ